MSKTFSVGTKDYLIDFGTDPASDGIIGTRNFSSVNYLTDFQSITQALSAIDTALKTEEDARIAVGNRPIDDSSWGALTDITQWDVSGAAHGLTPKLPGTDPTLKFLRGDGTWNIPPLGFTFRAILPTAYDETDTGQGGNIILGTNYEWDVSSIVPAGYTQVYVFVYMRCKFGASNSNNRYGFVFIGEGATGLSGFKFDGPPPFQTAAIVGPVEATGFYVSTNGLVKLSSSREIRISFGNYSGATTDWMNQLGITIMAYR